MPVVIDGNKELLTPVRDVLEIIQQQLWAKNSGKLSKVRYHGNQALITCPSHKMGLESTPSCGVLLEDKGNLPAGTVHCFACGYRASLVKFVADCLDVSYKSATEWLLNVGSYSLIADKRDVGEILFDEQSDPYRDIKCVSCEELKKYDYWHIYMKERRLTDEVIQKYDVGYDRESNSLTFPVYVDGRCLFVARRSVYGKKFLMPDISPKPIYGVDYLKPTDKTVYVTESVINALTLVGWGYPAIALFGTGSNTQIEQLGKLACRSFMLCLDGDKAGDSGIERISKYISRDKLIEIKVMPRDGTDINDMTKEQFDALEVVF